MRIMAGQGGLDTYFLFEPGDLVRLRRDEAGPIVTTRAGDWGRVMRVHPCGAVDIRLAGFSRAKDDPMPRAMAVPARCIEPCDERGMPLARGFRAVWDTRKGR